MTECPHCHRQIEINEINYGTLFNCPLCNAVFFVGWDGLPERPPTAEEMAAENAALDEAVEVPVENAFVAIETNNDDAVIDNSTYENQSYESLPENSGFADTDELSNAPGAYAAESTGYETNEFSRDDGDESSASAEPGAPFEAPTATNYSDEPATPTTGRSDTTSDSYDFSQPLGEQSLKPADEPGFADVTEFANSNAGSGPLTYNLRISGIDSGKIYGELKEALSDSRFSWDVPEIMKTIQGGSLNLTGLNPAKAFVLINRIKYLPLQITWRQDVLAAP